jgi:5,10-methylenetetrahydrofolate reductase
VAVAHEVEAMGGRSIACLNARDRNLLGFRRDLLTASAYGVDQFLFVYGDEPLAGSRTSELTVRTMLAEGRRYAPGMRFGAATGLRPLPAWKKAADFLFVQIGFSLDDLLAWRAQVEVDVPVYAGVIVVASPAMARNLAKEIPGLAVPTALVERLERDRNAGVDAACDLVAAIRDSGAFEGVHLIPVARYREVSARLEGVLRD